MVIQPTGFHKETGLLLASHHCNRHWACATIEAARSPLSSPTASSRPLKRWLRRLEQPYMTVFFVPPSLVRARKERVLEGSTDNCLHGWSTGIQLP
eukprot:4047489-Amphidinium_carterae.2